MDGARGGGSAQGRKEQEWAGQARHGTAETPMLASGSYQRSQPTHCGSRFAESSSARVSEGVAAQGTVRNPAKSIPARESTRGWPETWAGTASRRARPDPGLSHGTRTAFSRVLGREQRLRAHRLQTHLHWFEHLTLPPTSCCSFAKLRKQSVPPFSHLWNGYHQYVLYKVVLRMKQASAP